MRKKRVVARLHPETFGALFAHLRRTRTKLSLREFCQRNRFDWGEMSRLERGLRPPPVDAVALTLYAEALGLERDSAEWHDFMAAAKRQG